MNVLVVDMTHGGAVIASQFAKIPGFHVYAWDIYKTLKSDVETSLIDQNVELVGVDFLKGIDEELWVIAPVHCDLKSYLNDVTDDTNGNDGTRINMDSMKFSRFMTHHEAVEFLMRERINVPVIEVTGVKGKTSTVSMLKEIFKDLNPLILSSLGVEVLENGESHVLKSNLSITPASIVEAWELLETFLEGYENPFEVGLCIFEVSLGGTGLADVGVLTNLVENYPVANGTSSAAAAKSQIFRSRRVVCDFESFNSFYLNKSKNLTETDFMLKTSEELQNEMMNVQDKTNTFGLNPCANVKATNVDFGFHETRFQVEVHDLKTVNENLLNTFFEVSAFAPAPYHLQNILSVICTALTLETPIDTIKKGLKSFKGIKGRTSIRNYRGVRVIEEINPGLNVEAVKKAVDMLKRISDEGDSTVIFGGKYGVTCEEIDEKAVSSVLNALEPCIHFILADDLGGNVKHFIKRDFLFKNSLDDALDHAVLRGSKNVLVVYRSNYSDVERR
jgi:UDP-N-acetylmuramyl pentapeptide synthase